MKTLFTLVAMLLITITSFAQQSSDSTQDPAALTNAFFKSLLDENSSAMEKLVASDFNIISYNGQSVDGSMLAQGVSGGFVVIDSGSISGVTTRQYNSDAAVTTGFWKAKGSIQGQSFDNNVAFSVVSVKQNGTWKIANVQLTPAQ